LKTVVAPLFALQPIPQVLVLLGRDMTSGGRIFLISIIIFFLFLMIAWIVAAICLFKHKRSFPNFFITLLLIEFLGGCIIMVISVGVFNAAPVAEDYRDLLGSFLALVVFASYMARSKRVRNTFIGKPHAEEERRYSAGEWNDADKEKFKRLMDAQPQSEH
jgi:hypothetical protein